MLKALFCPKPLIPQTAECSFYEATPPTTIVLPPFSIEFGDMTPITAERVAAFWQQEVNKQRDSYKSNLGKMVITVNQIYVKAYAPVIVKNNYYTWLYSYEKKIRNIVNKYNIVLYGRPNSSNIRTIETASTVTYILTTENNVQKEIFDQIKAEIDTMGDGLKEFEEACKK